MNPGALPPLPDDCYPPGAQPLLAPGPLVETRPRFSPDAGDVVAIGFDVAMDAAVTRARATNARQVVTRCYSDETRIATPSLARFWCIQEIR